MSGAISGDRSRARLEHGDVRVGIDTDVAGDAEAATDDVGWLEVGRRDERARGGEGIRAPGSDGENSVVGLDDVSGAGDDEAVLAVDDDEQRLEPAEHAVAAPVLRELDGGARQVARVALELLLELLEEGERVGRGSGEAGEQLAAAEGANLVRVRLHDGLADGHLPIAPESDLAVAAHGEDGRGADARKRAVHPRKILSRTSSCGVAADSANSVAALGLVVAAARV